MKDNVLRKGMVYAIVVLFIGVSIIPLTGIGAENHCLINDSIGYFNSIRKSEECGVNVTLNGTMGDNGWYISCVTITFTVNGEVDYIMYKLDDGEWTVYTEPFVVCEDGEHTLYWYYVDNEGNQSAVECIDFKIEKDLIPPETEHDFSGIMGDNDWYVSDVTVTLIATDNAAGVNYTMYKLDDGEWTEYNDPFLVREDGEHTIEYYSVDKVGNKEEVNGPFDFKIDHTAPNIELTIEHIVNNTYRITAIVDDETSGVERVEFYINGILEFTDYEAPYEYICELDISSFIKQAIGIAPLEHPSPFLGDDVAAIVYDYAGNSKINDIPGLQGELEEVERSTAFTKMRRTSFDPVLDGNTLYVGGSGSGNYTKIQEAIDNASNSDTVFVFDDSSPYYENIVVDKSINLIGENKDTTVIDGNGSGDVINILADQVKINGFTVRNGNKGISLGDYFSYYDSSNCNISNCNIYNTVYGIYLDWECSYNDIYNCNIYDNDYGICLDHLVKDVNGDGFITMADVMPWTLGYPPYDNDILNCYIYDNDYGISLWCAGKFFIYGSGNTIMGNTIVSNNVCGLDLGSANYNIISDNIILDNNYGIDLYETYVIIEDPWLSHAIMHLGPSTNNIITGNNISNHNYGVKISHENWNYPSDSNQIYHNNFMNNNHQAQSYDGLYGPCENIWDNGYPSGGNYWSDFDEPSEGAYNDYHGENQDYVGSDGIVDIGLPTGGLNPYNIPDDINQDQYPLIVPYPTSTTSSPIINDVKLITSDPLDTIIGWEYFSCTVTDNDGVDEVKLIVTYPDTTTAAHTMTNIPSTNTYYYNMTLSDPGNYTYHIWANDTIGNYNTSTPQQFNLSMNEDVDMNGQTYFEDLIAITLRYGETGPPGWIREDVDNNGEVYFDDLLAVVLHYGEWWK